MFHYLTLVARGQGNCQNPCQPNTCCKDISLDSTIDAKSQMQAGVNIPTIFRTSFMGGLYVYEDVYDIMTTCFVQPLN